MDLFEGAHEKDNSTLCPNWDIKASNAKVYCLLWHPEAL